MTKNAFEIKAAHALKVKEAAQASLKQAENAEVFCPEAYGAAHAEYKRAVAVWAVAVEQQVDAWLSERGY